MNTVKRASIFCLAALFLSLPLGAAGQWDKKPAAEWSDKDAQKLLNDSPWARTQVFTSPLAMFREEARQNQRPGSTTTGVANATHINFRIRFFSARPIRQALGRLMEVKQKNRFSEEMAAQLKGFTEGAFEEYIVVTVTCDSQEAGANASQANSLLYSRGTADLKNGTFLEIKGGKRVFLQEYQRPKADGLGARFIFPRKVHGETFITPDSEEIRFYTELDSTYKLDRRFKVKEMLYEGKLEY